MSSAPSERGASLGTRLTLFYLGVFLASTLVLVAAAGASITWSFRSRTRSTMTAHLAEHREAFVAQGVPGLARLTGPPRTGLEPLYVRVIDEHAATVFEYRSRPDIAFDTPAMPARAGATRVGEVRSRGDGRPFTVGTTALPGGLRLVLAVSDEQTEESFAHLRTGLVVAWGAAILLGLVGGFFFTRRALRPLSRLASTAQAVIDSGDLGLRVPVRGTRDELDRLSRLFNGVLERNEALVRRMREALDNVAHDLRTPLTRLRTGAELALQGPADPARLRDALADGIEETERTLAMLTTLMDISEAEAGVMKLERAPQELAELVRDAVGLYEHLASERGLHVVTHLAPDVRVDGDRARLFRAVTNLVDNALKYTRPGGHVELTVERQGHDARLVVHDTGIGIAEAELPRIWERLYRADSSRSERGLGLGLSFVKAIVEAHGGRVEVESAPAAGTTFTVWLPLAR